MTRTTLNLDEDVARQLSELARRRGRSVSRVANQALRAGLLAGAQPMPLRPYEPPEVDTGRSLMEVTDISEVLDRLESV